MSKTRAEAGQPAAASELNKSPIGIRTASAARAEEACREWIEKLSIRPANKQEAFAQAQDAVKRIGSLSEKAFERAWEIAAPQEWRKPGRRKKQK